MAEQTERDLLIAALRMAGAQQAILRDLARHMVEENYIDASKTSRIFLDAAMTDMPSELSTGETYDAAREELLLLASAFSKWPGSQQSGRARPRPDPTPD